jgi:hypothetical protein
VTDYLEVKNWKDFQHYKNRDPLWIKLYRRVLADYAFSRLPDASKMHLVGIWLVASEQSGRIPNDAEWIARRIAATEPVDLQLLVETGFLLPASRKQSASKPLAKRLPRDRDREREIADQKKPTEKTTWLTPFADAWQAKCGEPPHGRLAKALAPLVQSLGGETALARWTQYLDGHEPRYCSPESFVARHQQYAGPETQEMTDEFGRMVLHRKNGDGKWEVVA